MEPRSSARFRSLLKGHRDARRWSQERLAEESDIDHSLISRIEGGTRRATRDAIAKLARGLGLTDAEWDELLLAADFRALDPAATVRGIPEVERLYNLLREDDDALDPGPRDTLRRIVSDAMSMAELATARGG